MANKIIKGDDLMLFAKIGDKYKSIAYATSHVLTLSAEATDTSTKDHGIWGGSEINKITWEITSENLYTTEAYLDLFDIMISRNPVDVVFGLEHEDKSQGQSVVDGDYPYWTPDYDNGSTGSAYLNGQAYITSLVANANNGENATFSITLTGKGGITKETANPNA